MRAAAGAGISISEYNEMTPYELSIYIQEYNKYEQFMQRERVTAAYLGAYFERVKKMPDLKKLLDDEPRPVKTKDEAAAEMFAEVSKLNAMFGGTVDKHFKGD